MPVKAASVRPGRGPDRLGPATSTGSCWPTRPRWRSSWPPSAPRSGTPSRTGAGLRRGCAELVERHPEHAAAIAAYHERWPEMLGGDIGHGRAAGRAAGGRRALYALTNWSAETFVVARERFGFLDWFDGVLVSGEERLVKPDRPSSSCWPSGSGWTPGDLLRRRLGGQRGRRPRARVRRRALHRSRAAATRPGRPRPARQAGQLTVAQRAWAAGRPSQPAAVSATRSQCSPMTR